jgi:hypothetical protein
VNVGVEEIVDAVKWAVVIGILSPFLAFAVALLKKVSRSLDDVRLTKISRALSLSMD